MIHIQNTISKSRSFRLFLFASISFSVLACSDNPPQKTVEPVQENEAEIRALIKQDPTNRFESTRGLMSNGDSISLNRLDTSAVQFSPLSKKTLDSLMAPHDNWHQKALSLETYLQNRFKGQVQRDSNNLILKMLDGSDLTVRPMEQHDELALAFEWYYEQGYYVIRVQRSEGNHYRLINANNGEDITMNGRPILNDEGTYMLQIGCDLDARYSFNGFVLQPMEANKGVLIEREPANWGVEAAKWVGPQKVLMKCRSAIPNSAPFIIEASW
ncbi:hypothetical protein KFE98_16475 [bacterium SCSIO 12741]|nr:hypothetical protein KFE98_16475 [bacterium SCSIO 12741]